MKTAFTLLITIMFSNAFCQTITTIAGTGMPDYDGDGGQAIFAAFKEPFSLAFDKHGNLYISDSYNNVIRKINTSGFISTVVGTGVAGYSGDGNSATNAKIFLPDGIAIDSNDNIFFADAGNNVIRKVDASGIISTFAGTGSSGYSGDGAAATNAKLSYPYGVTIDHIGNLLFSDAGNYVIRKIDHIGNITTIAGCGVFGDSGEGGLATNAKIKYPGVLAIHPKTGELYFPVDANRKVMKVDGNGIISTVAGSGGSGNDGDGGPAILAKMNAPNAVCFDTSGNMYISDNLAHVVRKVNTSGFIYTVAGTGVSGFNGDGPATSSQVSKPNGSTFDKLGNLYFADGSNHRIRRIDFNPTSTEYGPALHKMVKVFPNPSTREVTVIADVLISSLIFTNILGQEVLTQQPARKETTINIETLPMGFYSIKVNGKFGSTFVK